MGLWGSCHDVSLCIHSLMMCPILKRNTHQRSCICDCLLKTYPISSIWISIWPKRKANLWTMKCMQRDIIYPKAWTRNALLTMSHHTFRKKKMLYSLLIITKRTKGTLRRSICFILAESLVRTALQLIIHVKFLTVLHWSLQNACILYTMSAGQRIALPLSEHKKLDELQLSSEELIKSNLVLIKFIEKVATSTTPN